MIYIYSQIYLIYTLKHIKNYILNIFLMKVRLQRNKNGGDTVGGGGAAFLISRLIYNKQKADFGKIC